MTYDPESLHNGTIQFRSQCLMASNSEFYNKEQQKNPGTTRTAALALALALASAPRLHAAAALFPPLASFP